MTIKELINKLKEYDENMEVVVYDWEEYTYDNAFTFRKQIRAYTEDKGKKKGLNVYRDIEEAKRKTKGIEGVKYDDMLVIFADY